MDIRLQDRASAAVAASKGLGRAVASGPGAAALRDFAGSVSARTSVKLREAFANLTRQIPAGCGSSIAAHGFATRSLL
jgi:hypothetical protein